MNPLTLLIIFFLIMPTQHFLRNSSSQEDAIIEGVDVKQTIVVAEAQLEKHIKGSSLGFWVLRDQVVTPADAELIVEAYNLNIEFLSDKFDIWHFTWSISNLYRCGSPEVKVVLEEVYKDALKRAEQTGKRAAIKHTSDEKLYCGYFHSGGWRAARKFLVVPDDERFLQSSDEFFEKEKRGTQF